MSKPYTIELFDELIEWLSGPDVNSKDADNWADMLRPYATELAIRETNEARAYERGYRAGQLRSLQEMANSIRVERERVTADAELSAIRIGISEK